MKRRTFIKTAAASAAVAATQIYAPYIMAKPRPKLRVLGTHVTLQEPIRKRAELDLGIDIEFHPGGSAEVLYQASNHPESFDIYEQWSNSLKVLWQAESIQPIDKREIQHWHEINNLTKTGRIVPGAGKGLGDAPYKLLYVQPDRTLSANESNFISFLPYVHNTDAFGYNSAVIPKGIPYETEAGVGYWIKGIAARSH